MTYDPQAIFDAIDANIVGFLALGGIALIFNYGYFAGAGTAARRDSTWICHVGMQTFWFAGAIAFFGPAFREPAYLAMAATSIGGGVALALLVHKLGPARATTT